MRYFWIALFAIVPLAVVACFLYAAAHGDGLWFPENVSSIGREIDRLFWLIFAITGAIFLGVQLVFLYFLWKYGRREDPGRRPVFTHGNQRLETVWTIVPAGILFFLAIFQLDTWKRAKFTTMAPDAPLHARVTAGQFEWRFRYPGADGRLDTPDDLEQVNILHVWKGQDVKLQLESRDVLHSLFIPAVRLKQDLVPGMKQPYWFRVVTTDDDPSTPDVHEIACAELCGWGHYKMRGKLIVHETEEEFRRWFAEALRRQNADTEDLGLVE